MGDWVDKMKGVAKDAMCRASAGSLCEKPEEPARMMMEKVKGEVYIVSKDEAGQSVKRPAHVGDNVMPNERVVTGDNGAMQMKIRENGVESTLSAGPNANINCAAVLHPPAAEAPSINTAPIAGTSQPVNMPQILGVRG